MSVYDERPWLARYDKGQPSDVEPEHQSALAMFTAALERNPDAVVSKYFDGELTLREVDEQSDALAVALAEGGFERGDRLAVFLQNVPQFLLSMVATWKAGGTMVSVNPMSKQKELSVILDDSGAKVLVCLEGLHEQVAKHVVGDSSVTRVITTSELDYQTRHDDRLFKAVSKSRPEGTDDFVELIDRHRGKKPEPVHLGLDDTAFLTYTSGTTGPPKGAMNSHRNVVFNSQWYRDWTEPHLSGDDSILGVAPLFHITGLIGHIGLALLVGCPLVLFYRFDPGVALDVIREHRPTFTVGSITVFISLMNAPDVKREDLESLTKIMSGGAPIPPSTVRAFRDTFGSYIHNIYGLTETTSPSHGTPWNAEAPVDEASGALSVGVPIYNTIVRIQGEDGKDLPAGEVGELVTEGPQVVKAYWNKPEETENALGGGRLRTGDVGYMDSEGWFYIVDRKKDQINASGYKVWPREVEDVLYEHPAVLEAAVVGVPDEYRGETVKAFVSLRAGQSVEEKELIAFCKERMAAYKYPRSVEVVDELPKTTTGKILRRELRTKSVASQT